MGGSRMSEQHPKQIRRRLLETLYRRYMTDPLEMLSPEDFLEDAAIARETLVPNMHYLSDRGLVEMLIGFNPPMFDAARITSDGIDLVENRLEFDLWFPAAPEGVEAETRSVPVLMERLVEAADHCALDGEARRCLLRDVQFLRDELARPAGRWRREVIETFLRWLGGQVGPQSHVTEVLGSLRAALDPVLKA